LAGLAGLAVPTVSDVLNISIHDRYVIGDIIGVWPIFALTETEIIAGRDNRHLDFRVSVLKRREGQQATVTVSTICTVHNLFGRIYLAVVVPFHKRGVPRLLANAVSAGRL